MELHEPLSLGLALELLQLLCPFLYDVRHWSSQQLQSWLFCIDAMAVTHHVLCGLVICFVRFFAFPALLMLQCLFYDFHEQFTFEWRPHRCKTLARALRIVHVCILCKPSQQARQQVHMNAVFCFRSLSMPAVHCTAAR